MSETNGTPTPPPAPLPLGGWKPIALALVKKYGWWLTMMLGWIVASVIAMQLKLPPPPMPPIPVGDAPPAYAQGWVENPDEVARVVAGMKYQTWGATEAGQSDAALPDHVYLWQAVKVASGKDPDNHNQGQVGSCVSFGTATAIERTLATQIAIGHTNEEYHDLAEEVIYGGSRVQVGGGKMRGDGSVGAWAAKFVHDYGIVKRGPAGTVDLTTYSESVCRKYGNPPGPPADVLTLAKEHPVAQTAPIDSWADAKSALANGYGIAVCSGQGFSMKRDANGIARPQGSWAHCMCLDGFQVSGGAEYGHIQNSWGPTAFSGPTGWGEPPLGGFWADSSTVGKMLGQGDSFAFSSVKGFPANKLPDDWFVLAPMPQQTRYSFAFQGAQRRLPLCDLRLP